MTSTRSPFFFATAAFPKFTREGMLERFDSKPMRLQFEGMLFADDLESRSWLWQRLMTVRAKPPHGKPPRDGTPGREQLHALVEALDPGSIAPAAEADRGRGRIISKQVGTPGKRATPSSAAKKYLEPAHRSPVIFRGRPGTGKTVQLQEVAVAHARAGRAVLFTCFNKVLASTLRGILATQRLGEAVDRRVIVTHVDELRRQLDQDDLQAFRGLFGTVCVDEAQDMPDEYFDFLRDLVSDQAEWFLADGPGQELYGEASQFLLDAQSTGTVATLRRNFRNAATPYL